MYIRVLSVSIIIAVALGILIPLYAARRSPRLKVGDKAPDFSLQGDDGKTYKLSDYDNQKVVLYFYPKDDSRYCIKQACSIAREYTPYKTHNIKVFGINTQTPRRHARFKKKYDLPFTILSDPSGEVAKAYGAYSPLFIKRKTFLIEDRKIVNIIRNVDVYEHGNEILKAFGVAS